jgi:hypothetical protein
MFEIQARFLYSHEKILLKMRVTMKKRTFFRFFTKMEKMVFEKKKNFFLLIFYK